MMGNHTPYMHKSCLDSDMIHAISIVHSCITSLPKNTPMLSKMSVPIPKQLIAANDQAADINVSSCVSSTVSGRTGQPPSVLLSALP
uniref:Uncharacterized protein n=1 Tax=Setaria italica TaxID=4555 RepID=K3YB82_SETIT